MDTDKKSSERPLNVGHTSAVTDFTSPAQDFVEQIGMRHKVVHRIVKSRMSTCVNNVREKARKTSKSRRTRGRILDAASQLILEHGSTGFQMSEVADRCDMSKGALYYYFSDRDAIVEEIFSQVIDEFATRLENVLAISCSSEEVLRSLIRTFSQSVQEGGLFVAAMVSELVRGGSNVWPQLRRRFAHITQLMSIGIERAQAEGLVRSDVNPEVVATTICGAVFFGASKKFVQDRKDFDVDEISDMLYSIIIYGIGRRSNVSVKNFE